MKPNFNETIALTLTPKPGVGNLWPAARVNI